MNKSEKLNFFTRCINMISEYTSVFIRYTLKKFKNAKNEKYYFLNPVYF